MPRSPASDVLDGSHAALGLAARLWRRERVSAAEVLAMLAQAQALLEAEDNIVELSLLNDGDDRDHDRRATAREPRTARRPRRAPPLRVVGASPLMLDGSEGSRVRGSLQLSLARGLASRFRSARVVMARASEFASWSDGLCRVIPR